MFYAIYKITNLLDGKIYIGSHKTKKLDDAYMGSGRILIHAQKKYGIENFKKEILFVFDNPEDMYAKEAELVNEEFLVTENTYNLKVGGYGGWDHVNSRDDNPYHSKQHMKMMSVAGQDACQRVLHEKRKDPNWVLEFNAKAKLAAQKRISAPNFIPPMKGKKQSDAARAKISAASRINQLGEKNSQYGKKKTEVELKKQKETWAKKTPIRCPHCEVESNSAGTMYRWHFDNCKKKPSNT